MADPPDEPSERAWISRLLAVGLVCLLLTTALVGPAITAALGPAVDASDYGSAGDDNDNEIEIDDALEDTDGTVAVVVRLEEATVPDDLPGDETETVLEDHAEASQEPLLEYAARTPGITVETEFWLTNAVLLTVDTDRVALETFERFPAVEAVHENFELSVPERPTNVTEPAATSGADGPETGGTDRQTTVGLDLLNAPAVWETYETQGEGARVAVLDTGIDATHPDLDLYTENSSDPTYPGGWAEFDAHGDRVVGSTPYDSGTHGTHVSGTVAGGDGSGTQIGVAPEAELLHGLVLDETSGSFAQIIAGMEWALEADADVINLSLGASGRHGQLIDPVRNAKDSGTVVVAAVGNEGVETSNSPANVYDAISVGAVHENGAVPAFSGGERINRTEWRTSPDSWPASYAVPDVVAHGVGVTSTVPDGGYERYPGTSMATPHVAGTAALLLSVDPTATPADLSSVLSETARNPGDRGTETDIRYGYGIVDAKAATDVLLTGESAPAMSTTEEPSGTDGEERPLVRTLVAGGVSLVVVAVSVWAMLAALALSREPDRE